MMRLGNGAICFMNFSIWSTPSIAQFFTGNNLCKEKIGKFFIMCLDCPKDLSGFINMIDSIILSRLLFVCGTE